MHCARWCGDDGLAATLSDSWRWHACGHVCLYQWAHFVAAGAGAAIGAVGVKQLNIFGIIIVVLCEMVRLFLLYLLYDIH